MAYEKLLLTNTTIGSVDQICVGHLTLCFEETLYKTFHRCFLPNYGSFGYSVLEE